MSLPEHTVYEFGVFRLEPGERLLSRSGVAVPLTPKAFDLLVVLVTRAGRVVKKDDLLREVWPDTFVEEANLSYTVSLLRKALEGGSDDRGYIDTVQKLGYRFAVPVRSQAAIETPAPVALAPHHGSGPTQSATGAAETDAGRTRRERWYVAVAAAAVMLAAIATLALLTRPVPDRVAARLDVALPPFMQEGKEPTISPDGRALAMTAILDGRLRLVVRRLDSPTLVPIAGADGGWLPIWSPDSKAIAFLHGTTLKKVEIAGGPVVDLCEAGLSAGGDWSRAGVILFGSGQSGRIHRTSASGGSCEAVTTLDVARGETAHRWPNFLPDGRHFLYSVDGREGGLYVGALDSHERKRLVPDGGGGHYVSPGYLLFRRGTTLMAQRFDVKALEARGEAFVLVENVGLGSVLGTGFSVAGSGSIVYRPVTEDPSQLFWFTRDGSRLGPSGPAGSFRQVALSPGGRQAALTRRDPATGAFDLWLLDLTTGALSRFTSDPDFLFNDDPVWSPDGRSVAFLSRNTTGQFRPFIKDLIMGARQRLGEEPMHVDCWMRDGQFIIAHRFSTQGIAAYALSPTGTEKPRVLFDAPYVQDQLQVSPDGQWVAFNANESGRFEVYVAKFPQFTERRQISIAGGAQPLWRRDGRELFYLTMHGVLMAAAFNPDAPTEGVVPRALFDTNLQPDPGLSEYAVTADGQRFLVVQRQAQTITILMNWLDGRASN